MVKIRYELDDEERHALLELRRQGAIDPDMRSAFTRTLWRLVDAHLAKLVGALERVRTGRKGYELTPEGNALADELECAETRPGDE